MNPINKYEAVGIFLSVAIMAVALAALRFNSNQFTTIITPETNTQQGAIVVASEDAGLKDALTKSVTGKGELAKLVIDDVKIGEGKEVAEGDTVVAHYIGTTRDGVQFDSSYVRGTPFEFTVGAGKVIQGWEKGIIGMKVGGQRILVIPSDMAYGNRQVGAIPANSPLVFAIELLEIK